MTQGDGLAQVERENDARRALMMKPRPLTFEQARVRASIVAIKLFKEMPTD